MCMLYMCTYLCCLVLSAERARSIDTLIEKMTPSIHILFIYIHFPVKKKKYLFRVTWFKDQGSKSTRWVWSIMVCQKVRKCSKTDGIMLKEHWNQLEGDHTCQFEGNNGLNLQNEATSVSLYWYKWNKQINEKKQLFLIENLQLINVGRIKEKQN